MYPSRVRRDSKLMTTLINSSNFRLHLDYSRGDEEDEIGTLCQCALKVVKDVLPETKLTPILSDLLAQERADTLSK